MQQTKHCLIPCYYQSRNEAMLPLGDQTLQCYNFTTPLNNGAFMGYSWGIHWISAGVIPGYSWGIYGIPTDPGANLTVISDTIHCPPTFEGITPVMSNVGGRVWRESCLSHLVFKHHSTPSWGENTIQESAQLKLLRHAINSRLDDKIWRQTKGNMCLISVVVLKGTEVPWESRTFQKGRITLVALELKPLIFGLV